MSVQKPIIINQAELAWEGWDDPVIADKSGIRWKLLVSGERGPSSGLVPGVAEVHPVRGFPFTTTNLTRPITSSAALVI